MVKQSQDNVEYKQPDTEQRTDAFFHSLSDCCPVSIFTTDTDGRCTYINPRFDSLYGYSTEESLGKGWTQFVHSDDSESALTKWFAHTQNGSEFSHSCRFQTQQGAIRWVYVRSAPLLEDGGNLIGYVNTVEDITQYKQTEDNARRLAAQIQEQANVLNPILSASVDHIYVFDRAGCYQYVSQGGANVMGYEPQELVGKTWQDIHLPADLMERVDRQREAVMATGQPIRAETDYMAADGMHYYEYIMTPWRSSDQTIEGVIAISRNITQRKQAEEALRLSQKRYCLLAESLPQLVSMAGTDGITEYCNQSWMNYTGLTLEQTQSSGWQQALHPDDLPLIREQWTQALETGNAYSMEFRIRRVDGVYRWHLSKIVPIKAEKDRIVGWLGTATDIDDQKRTEQQERFLAQASQTFAAASLDLQTVLNTITRLVSEFTGDVCSLSLLSEDGPWLNPVSCYHVDPEVREFVSQLLSDYPRRADEGIGGPVMQTGEPLLMPVTSQQEFRAAIKPEYQHYLERFKVCSTLIVPLKVQGQAIGVLSLTRNHPGEPHNIDDQNLFQDLADRAAMAIANARLYQQAKQARQQAEKTADRTARLQAVTAALSEPLTPAQVAEVIVEQSIAVLNASSAVVAIVNPNGTELEIVHFVGYQQDIPEAWRRFPITTPVPLAEAVRTGEPIWEESTQERIARYPHLAQNYAELNYAAWISLPLMVEGRAVGGISINFAEFSPLSQDDRAFMLALAQQCAQAIARAHLYEAEQRARASAEAANRIKDEFLAVLSHELRSPLNPILGWTRLLRTRKFDESARDKALETIERNAKLQTQLIGDLLDVSRIIQGKMALNVCPVNLSTTIEAAIETVHLAAQTKGIQIQTQLDWDVEPICGDPGRLQQIVWNLLSNAVKFTPAGGQVEVRLEPIDSFAQIQVKDTGKGISREFLPHVFEYFRQENSTTTRIFGGLGLGLAIVRHLTELHGGTVQAESPGEGQGATFTVLIPRMVAVAKTSSNNQPSTTTIDLSGLRVLVVDDEADMRDLVDFILGEYGANVRVAASAAEALLVLDQFNPDLLVSDIGMPEMDGYMLMRQIQARYSQQSEQIPGLSESMPKAIALTAYAGEVNQQQALAAGFHMHLPKPVEPEDLVRAIANLVTRV
jgi:PAS domain S-box-containing protein